jgi:hypothetical protein
MATSTKNLKEVLPAVPEEVLPAVKPEFTEDELLQVFDSIMFSGEYSETIKLRGKLAITFRMRTIDESLEISKKLDTMQANLISTLNEQRAVINLSYAIVDYAGKDLSKASVEDKVAFIGKLPVPIIAAMFDALSKFDRKTNLACSEAEGSF